jgi:hypothetical protein
VLIIEVSIAMSAPWHQPPEIAPAVQAARLPQPDPALARDVPGTRVGVIENWTEVARARLDRLGSHLDRNPEEALQKLVAGAEDALHGVSTRAPHAG